MVPAAQLPKESQVACSIEGQQWHAQPVRPSRLEKLVSF